jgi:diguanylate cyclase (GGDEF)-like protein
MDLRRNLLVFFFGLIGLVLVVFGYNAYQIAQQASLETEAKLLAGLNYERSQELAVEYREHPNLAHLSEHIRVDRRQIRVLLVLVLVDGTGRILAASSEDVRAELGTDRIDVGVTPPAGARGREIRLNDQLYTLAASAVSGSPFTLLHLVPRGYAAQDALARLASRLGITGLVIAWLAVWIALIISTAVARRIKTQTAKLEYQATHDALTGLPNRVALAGALDKAIAYARQTGRSVGLVLMDLNRFREINDTLGHDMGDRVLQEVSLRLRAALWENDTVARLGGDDFALLMPIADASHVRLVIAKTQVIMGDPFEIQGLSLQVDACLGVALYPDHADDAATLLRRAEVAMYHAKWARRTHTMYDPGKDPHSVDRLKLTADLRHAIERNEMFMVYQPKIDVGRSLCTGVEALLRWRHAERGLVAPDEFIRLAEQTGAIKDITYWTLEQSMAQARTWSNTGISLNVSVNLSALMLQDPELPSRISGLLKDHGLPPGQLSLEITETAIMLDPDGALAILGALDVLGVRLSIDDFGTGYTSLAYLKRLPVDEIKIDKSFVMNMLADDDDATIVQSIISLAHNMRRRVVAEGVESNDIMAALAGKGCDLAQGYLMSKPLPAAEFVQWLARSPWPVPRDDNARVGVSQPGVHHYRRLVDS